MSRTHRVALDRLFDRINLDSKIRITYIDTKNQLADILTKGNFTRDEWNHLLCLFTISHFSPIVCSAAMAKRSQQDSGEERVTAKSKPMMNLNARTPSFMSSSTSVSPVKRYYGKQDLWKSVVAEDRSGQLDNLSSTNYSKLDYDRARSSQEWKSEVTTHDRSGQLDYINSQEAADSKKFIMGSDATEFVNRVSDQVRKRQKKNVQRCRRRRRTF